MSQENINTKVLQEPSDLIQSSRSSVVEEGMEKTDFQNVEKPLCSKTASSKTVNTRSSTEKVNHSELSSHREQKRLKIRQPASKGNSTKNSLSADDHGKRKVQKTPESVLCPVCGLTVLKCDYEKHFQQHCESLFCPKRTRGEHSEASVLQNQEYDRLVQRRSKRPQAIISSSEIECPYCKLKILCRDIDRANKHLHSCFENCMQAVSGVLPDSESFEEIEVPPESLFESTTLRVTHSDENEILDVETDDTSIYGPSQYSDDDVALASNGISFTREVNENLDENVSNTSSNGDSGDTNVIREDSETVSDTPKQNKLVVETLRSRIEELENASGSFCPICNGAFKTPLVSVSCWHVSCEECWLRALNIRKMCAVCKSIVSPSDLRRIYM